MGFDTDDNEGVYFDVDDAVVAYNDVKSQIGNLEVDVEDGANASGNTISV